MSTLLNKLGSIYFWKHNAFLLIGITTLFWVIYKQSNNKIYNKSGQSEKYYLDVKNRLSAEIKQSELEIDKTISLIKESNNVSFSYLSQTSRYPFYIFKNNKVIYWSDYFFVPEYQKCKGDYTIKFEEFTQGKYLLLKRKYQKASGLYEIITAIPILRTYEENNLNLKNIYNTAIFPKDPQLIKTAYLKNKIQNFYYNDKQYLFSIVHPQNLIDRGQSANLILLLLLTGFSFLIHFRKPLLGLSKAYHKEFVFLLIIAFLFVIRFVFLYFDILSDIYDNELFSSQYNTNSFWQPTIADAFLNCLFCCIAMVYFINNYFRMDFMQNLAIKPRKIRYIVSIILVILSYVVTLSIAHQYNNIYKISGNLFNLELSIDFIKNPLKYYNISIFTFLSLLYFLCLHFLIYFHLKLNRDIKKPWKSFLIASFLIIPLVLFFSGFVATILCIINGVYFSLMYFFRLPRYYHVFRYQTSIYFFSAAFCCALMASAVSYEHEISKDFTKKIFIGKKYITENDEIIESKLNQINIKIKTDSSLREIVKSNFLSQERCLQYLNDKYFDSYFDNYTIELSLYDNYGISNDGGDNRTFFKNIEKNFINNSLKTSYENLYFMTSFNNSIIEKQYINILPIKSSKNKSYGHLVLKLKPLDNTLSSHSKSENFQINQQEITGFSYAIYKNKEIEIANGEYNYSKKLLFENLNDSTLFEKGLVKNGFKHI
nr:hypothetical protein [Pseudarcicella sp.]